MGAGSTRRRVVRKPDPRPAISWRPQSSPISTTCPRRSCGTTDVRRHRLVDDCRQGALRDPLRARLLREESPRLAELVAREMGKPIRYVREREIEPAIDPDPVLRRRRPADPRRGHQQCPGPPPQPRPEGAGRRLRAHHAVERSGRSASCARSAQPLRPGARSCSNRRATRRRRRWRSLSSSTGSKACRRAWRTAWSARAR